MPRTGAPPTIGETPTIRAEADPSASRIPGTERMVPIDTTGFDGATRIADADAIASRTPGAGRAAGAPARYTERTGSVAPRPTQYSWKCTSSPLSRTMRVSTGSSVIGRSRARSPNRRAMRAVASDNDEPEDIMSVRTRHTA